MATYSYEEAKEIAIKAGLAGLKLDNCLRGNFYDNHTTVTEERLAKSIDRWLNGKKIVRATDGLRLLDTRGDGWDETTVSTKTIEES